MRSRKRPFVAVVLAVLVAPLVPAVVGALTTPVTSGFDLGAAIGLVPVFYFFSLGCTVVLGLPLFLIVCHYGLIFWWSGLLGGAIAGSLVALLIRSPPLARFGEICWLAMLGAVSGLVFWAIWKSMQERPVSS